MLRSVDSCAALVAVSEARVYGMPVGARTRQRDTALSAEAPASYHSMIVRTSHLQIRCGLGRNAAIRLHGPPNGLDDISREGTGVATGEPCLSSYVSDYVDTHAAVVRRARR